jgi:AcrR family transcriptional regulator
MRRAESHLAEARPADAGADRGDTVQRILDEAERMFAENGYSGVSIRAITQAAGANVAAIHYHFGSKAALLDAVLRRRVEPMNAERHRRLDACLDRGGARPDPREVLEAFIVPALAPMAEAGGQRFAQLSGILSADPHPEVRAVIYRVYDEVAKRFVAGLRTALPDLPEEDLFWRLHAVYGAMMYIRVRSGRVDRLVDTPPTDVPAVARHLIAFLTAGMLAAPVSKEAGAAP